MTIRRRMSVIGGIFFCSINVLQGMQSAFVPVVTPAYVLQSVCVRPVYPQPVCIQPGPMMGFPSMQPLAIQNSYPVPVQQSPSFWGMQNPSQASVQSAPFLMLNNTPTPSLTTQNASTAVALLSYNHAAGLLPQTTEMLERRSNPCMCSQEQMQLLSTPVQQYSEAIRQLSLRVAQAQGVMHSNCCYSQNKKVVLESLSEVVNMLTSNSSVYPLYEETLRNRIDSVKNSLDLIEAFCADHEKEMFKNIKQNLETAFEKRVSHSSSAECAMQEASPIKNNETLLQGEAQVVGNGRLVSPQSQGSQGGEPSTRSWSPFSPISPSHMVEQFVLDKVCRSASLSHSTSRAATPHIDQSNVTEPVSASLSRNLSFATGVVLQEAPKKGRGATIWKPSSR